MKQADIDKRIVHMRPKVEAGMLLEKDDGLMLLDEIEQLKQQLRSVTMAARAYESERDIRAKRQHELLNGLVDLVAAYKAHGPAVTMDWLEDDINKAKKIIKGE